jgi:N-carbamoylputrescine amidase
VTVLRIALLQLAAQGVDQEANAATGEAACRTAKAMGADIALLPEMWNIGYSTFWPGEDEPADLLRAPSRWTADDRQPEPNATAEARATWQARAIGVDDPFVSRFRGLARELDMAIGLTFFERWPGSPRNTLCLIDRHGEIALTYAKVHTCCFSPMEAALTAGESFPVCALDTGAGLVAVGAMICFDREFPESARALMLNGAELILIPNACEMESHRIGQLRTRAWENQLAVALANYAAPQQNGHSVAFDPIAFDGEGRSRDTLVIEAGEAEGIFLADFNLDTLRDHREREAMGDAFRRPALYGALTERNVRPPFVRVDRAGRSWRSTQGNE